jgi:hypothetical protein
VTVTMLYTGHLVITTCWCGMSQALPDDLYRHAQNTKGFRVWCPLGHEWVVSENEADRQRKRADTLARQLEMARDSARWERDQRQASERSNAAYRGWITRYKNRIAAGVCPVEDCKRVGFSNVARHIERMHPAWAHNHPEALSA